MKTPTAKTTDINAALIRARRGLLDELVEILPANNFLKNPPISACAHGLLTWRFDSELFIAGMTGGAVPCSLTGEPIRYGEGCRFPAPPASAVQQFSLLIEKERTKKIRHCDLTGQEQWG